MDSVGAVDLQSSWHITSQVSVSGEIFTFFEPEIKIEFLLATYWLYFQHRPTFFLMNDNIRSYDINNEKIK